MKILKGFLILAILLVMCLGGISQTETRTADIQDGDITLYPQDSYYGDTTLELPPYWNGEWYRNNVNNNIKEEPETLLEWFKSLTLDEKVEIYNDWNKVDYDDYLCSPELVVTW